MIVHEWTVEFEQLPVWQRIIEICDPNTATPIKENINFQELLIVKLLILPWKKFETFFVGLGVITYLPNIIHIGGVPVAVL